MRILFISQWFAPEPFFKGLPFARALRDRGHEVEVLTGFPNYPGGRLHPGYRIRPYQCEIMDGIPVHRVPLYPSHDQSAIRRIANYASFALSAATIGPAVVRKADVAYVYHPPATVAMPAVALRILRGIPFVYDIQDLWPDTLAATGMLRNRLALRLVGGWCRATYRLAARIVVLSPGFKRMLVSRGVPAEKIEVIYNWCDESGDRDAGPNSDLPQRLGVAGRFTIVFAGTMGKAQGLDAVLDAAQRLRDELPEVQFVLVGGGVEVERLRAVADQMALRNVRFVPRVPMAEIGKILALADALLVHLVDDPLFTITVPSKTQAYLAAGRPILMGVKGDAADLVRKADAGICFQPEDPGDLCRAVKSLYALSPADRQRLGENGRTFYQRDLSMSQGVTHFEHVFVGLLTRLAGTS